MEYRSRQRQRRRPLLRHRDNDDDDGVDCDSVRRLSASVLATRNSNSSSDKKRGASKSTSKSTSKLTSTSTSTSKSASTSIVTSTRTKKVLALGLFCAANQITYHKDNAYSADAFSVLRPVPTPRELLSGATSSSASASASTTSLFLFSMKNDNNNENGENKIDNDIESKMDGNEKNGTTATVVRSETTGKATAGGGIDVDIDVDTVGVDIDDNDDFTAWMKGLKLGTPIGKMASKSLPLPAVPISVSSPEGESESSSPSSSSSPLEPAVDTTTSISAEKAQTSRKIANAEKEAPTKTKPSKIKNISSISLRNPLSNLIQFEAMLELAKIAAARSKEEDEDGNNDGNGNGNGNNKKGSAPSKASTAAATIGNATDVFAVVDKLFKTFQTQEEAKQQRRLQKRSSQKEQQKELLRLAQLEKTAATTATTSNNDNKGNNSIFGKKNKKNTNTKDLQTIEETNNNEGDKYGDDDNDYAILVEEMRSETTVEDLMELERYVGKIPFRKKSNIWDTFSSKTKGDGNGVGDGLAAVADIDDDDDDDDDVVGIRKEAGNESKGKQSDDTNDDDDDSPLLATDASSSLLFRETYGPTTKKASNNLVQAAETILKDTTAKMEYLVAEASSRSSNNSTTASGISLQDLVGRASSVFYNTDVESISNEIVAAAQKIAKESGVDFNVQFAADRAREATEFAVGVATAANAVLDAGYAYGSRSGAAGMTGRDDGLNYRAASAASQRAGSVLARPYELGSEPQPSPDSESESNSNSKSLHQTPLLGDFASAQRIEPYEYQNVVYQGAEVGSLAGAVYEDNLDKCHELGHSLVANGTSANVVWMVTDSATDTDRLAAAFRHHEDEYDDERNDDDDNENENDDFDAKEEGSSPSSPGVTMIRTITIRGFDASDESVDREELLSNICFATPEAMDEATADKVIFHKGLLTIARQLYADTKQYIDWASPNHKIVLNGHSVGGSLSVLMLLLITSDRGVDYVQDRILRVYSHGCPPIAAIVDEAAAASADSKFGGTQKCPVLDIFGLPPSMVYAFIQPYDPIVRLFSNHDNLYPLVDDLDADGITLYSSGPIRSLRPITRAIFQAWNGWPQFRDNWKGTCDTQYHSVGIQHLLLPEPLRYLNDRFISVNVGIPPVDAIVRISPRDLLPALDQTFPMDTFHVSLIPQAVRSFLHHFYPAYDTSLADYATKMKNQAEPAAPEKSREFKPFRTTQS